MSEENEAHARRCGHPFNLSWALSVGADLYDYLRKPEELRKRAQECEQIGRENSMPFVWACLAPVRQAMAAIREGKFDGGISLFKSSIAIWDARGGNMWNPFGKSILAEAMAHVGDVDGALRLIDDLIAQVERPGWEERAYYAEILRIKGWILSLKGDHEGAERSYLASLDWARHQRAKSWELRTATSLVRLWQGQGKRRQAYDLLAPIYNWFTEGFDTNDLLAARKLLDALQ
jgi:ATP/maltotriose-dependent transcriptional regulator MalT